MRRWFFLLLVLTFGFSTTISGEIYDGETFEPANNVVIRLTGPTSSQGVMQTVVSKNYSFDLKPGEYEIYAYSLEDGEAIFSRESISVGDGGLIYDLVLLGPEFQQDYDLDVEETEPLEKKEDFSLIIGFVIILILGFVVHYLLNKKEFEDGDRELEKEQRPRNQQMNFNIDEDRGKIVRILKENKGIMIQKELREILNFSESKMSLIITELEMDGLVKRIKKGRENILKLTGKGEMI
ncbi:hypothetical protein HYT84_00285 [Candidatus Micrarchaeota archaeon]|nr:hypothetical protein [Candidatus Micrarchaeota archaeon]